MSFLPFDFAGDIALSYLATPDGLQITDVRYDKQDYQDVQVVIGTRVIEAMIDKSGGRNVERIFGGSVSDGDILIITKETLFISDSYNQGQDQKQSFFQFYNFSYRVVGVDWWEKQMGLKVYHCKHHQVQEQV